LSNNDEKTQQQAKAAQLLVLSYNILDDAYVRPGFFPNTPRRLLRHRRPELLKEICARRADLVALQEVAQYAWWRAQLARHAYGSVHAQRRQGKTDGCSIFYNTKSLALVGAPHKLFFDVRLKADADAATKPNVALFVLLRLRTAPTRHIVFANCHLLWNPKRGDIKLKQYALLMSELHAYLLSVHALLPASSRVGVILAGDFNATPASELIRFVTDQTLQLLDRTRMDGQAQHTLSMHKQLLAAELAESKTATTQQQQQQQQKQKQKQQHNSQAVTTSPTHPLQLDWVLNTPEKKRAAKPWHVSVSPSRYRPTVLHYRQAAKVDFQFYTPFAFRPASQQQKQQQQQQEGAKETKGSSVVPVLRVSGFLDLPSAAQVARVKRGGLPTQRLRSDHFALLTQFDVL
jgi:mRNA deadenylase 3'-5' endonuclease subunit Ccr4